MTIKSEVGAIFGRRVREVRLKLKAQASRRGDWSQADLARRLTEAGHPMSQAVIARIEAENPGPRALKVSLDDVLAIAAVLGVSPLFLFLPREDDEVVSLAPRLEFPAAKVRAWTRGDERLREGDDVRIFETERDEQSAAQLAADKAARAKVEEIRRETASRRAEDKRRADELARILVDETAREIDELKRRGEPVPGELMRRHGWRQERLTQLRRMTAEEWAREEARRMDEEADSAADYAAEYVETYEEGLGERVEEWLDQGGDK